MLLGKEAHFHFFFVNKIWKEDISWNILQTLIETLFLQALHHSNILVIKNNNIQI